MAQNLPGPLRGLTVLDLSRLLPGGYCTLLLSDLGADVIKVEQPGRGDYLRWMPPLIEGVSAAHRSLNRGKRSITLDLKSKDGPRLLRRLAGEADVLVESFRPGVMDRLGVGYSVLSTERPELVFCAVTGYGQDGPYRDLVGHDLNYLGYGGGLSLGGPAGGPPAVPGLQIGDLGGGGMLASVGILAALHERHRTGRGRFVDVSMLDGVVSWLSVHAGAYLASGRTPEPGAEALTGGLACYRVYQARDGRYLTVGALEPKFWRELCEALGRPDLIDDQYGPPERQGELAAELQDILGRRDRGAWLELLGHTCVGPVNDLAEALADPQVRTRGMVAEVDGVEVGPGPALRLYDDGAKPRLAGAPALGEHTDEVLGELGLAPAELGRLRGGGVI